MGNLNEILNKINAAWGITGLFVFLLIIQNFLVPHIRKLIKIKYLKEEWIPWQQVKLNMDEIKQIKAELNGHDNNKFAHMGRINELESEQKYAKERHEDDIKLLEEFKVHQEKTFDMITKIKDRMIERRNG